MELDTKLWRFSALELFRVGIRAAESTQAGVRQDMSAQRLISLSFVEGSAFHVVNWSEHTILL